MPMIVWPAGSARSRVARSIAVALLLILSFVSQEMSILLFPGTNAYYGIVAWQGTAAYSLIEDRKLALRTGDVRLCAQDLRAIKGLALRSTIQTQDYVALADLLPALKTTRPGEVLFYYPPGYPLYLAGTFLASGQYRYDLARTIQLLLNMLGAPLLLLGTGVLLGSFATGYAAAALYALYAGPVQQTFYILPDALMPFLATLVLAVSAWCIRRDRLKEYLVLGLVLGVGANFRSDVLGMAPFLALGIWRFRRKLDPGTIARVAAVGLIAFSFLIPYGLIQKNFKPVGRFQITTPGLGQNLWEGYGETPNPHGAILSDDAVDEMLTRAGRHIHLPDGEAYLKEKWARAALREPRWFLWSVGHREKVLLGYWREGAKMGFAPLADSKRSPWRGFLIQGAQKAFSLLVVILFACGITALFASRFGLLIAAAPLGYFAAFSLLHVEPRYVLPALGPLTYLACHGVQMLAGRWSSRTATLRRAGVPLRGVNTGRM